jgi:hypothetical protein
LLTNSRQFEKASCVPLSLSAGAQIGRFAAPAEYLSKMTFRAYGVLSMKDLTDSRWIKVKGILFLVVGLLSSALILVEHHDLKTVFLLAMSVWCFCRFYYFAFYVIEHYVDPGYRFSGLWSFSRYLLSRRDRRSSGP